MNNVNSCLGLFKKIFLNDRDILFAYAFGSRVGEPENVISDFDIAVVLRNNQNSQSVKFLLKKEKELSTSLASAAPSLNIDLVLLNPASADFQFKVISTGKLIFSRDELKRCSFEADVILRYLEVKPFIDEYDNLLYRRLSQNVAS